MIGSICPSFVWLCNWICLLGVIAEGGCTVVLALDSALLSLSSTPSHCSPAFFLALSVPQELKQELSKRFRLKPTRGAAVLNTHSIHILLVETPTDTTRYDLPSPFFYSFFVHRAAAVASPHAGPSMGWLLMILLVLAGPGPGMLRRQQVTINISSSSSTPGRVLEALLPLTRLT